ncbi:hypothetical protein CBR_g9146 [Chara braunii]|uniref:TrmE-type G domain-containing protein n=1 Tax=Chara braunii TaxID=69332 RepID=A0A388KNV0_CHABU|nr:hypothetical protein CBR_g9146 [Chara braunii]|eukprot:GBG71736.1 hypothetical protein CBR_g9146 [Chara braunii]
MISKGTSSDVAYLVISTVTAWQEIAKSKSGSSKSKSERKRERQKQKRAKAGAAKAKSGPAKAKAGVAKAKAGVAKAKAKAKAEAAKAKAGAAKAKAGAAKAKVGGAKAKAGAEARGESAVRTFSPSSLEARTSLKGSYDGLSHGSKRGRTRQGLAATCQDVSRGRGCERHPLLHRWGVRGGEEGRRSHIQGETADDCLWKGLPATKGWGGGKCPRENVLLGGSSYRAQLSAARAGQSFDSLPGHLGAGQSFDSLPGHLGNPPFPDNVMMRGSNGDGGRSATNMTKMTRFVERERRPACPSLYVTKGYWNRLPPAFSHNMARSFFWPSGDDLRLGGTSPFVPFVRLKTSSCEPMMIMNGNQKRSSSSSSPSPPPPPPPPPPPSSSSSSSSSAAAVAAAAASGPSSSASAAAAAAAWNGEAVAGVVAYNGAKLAGASARSSMLAASRGDNGDPREIQLPNPSMSCHSVSTKSMIETAATSSKQSKQGPAVWSEADEYYADVGGRRVLNESQLRRPFAETSVRMGGRFPSEHATSEETEKGEGEGETRAAEEEDEIPHVSSSSATWQSRRTLTRSRSSGDEEEECDESLSSSVRSGRAKSFSVLGRSAAAERLRISKVRECTTTGIEEEEEEEEEQTTSSSAEVSTDTIAAIVTAVAGQQGAVAIVRLSGRDAIAITSRVFQPARKRRKAGGNATWRPESHRVEYGTVVDGDGRPVDEVIVVPMLAPRSYTREDVVELQCHGGEVCVSRVLQACLECGARLAKPGEFTLRAFLNGRLDLTQAESVADLVTARTSQAADSALAGLKGGMSSIIRSLRAECIDLLVEMEARLDFDDELPPFDPTVLAQRLTAMWKEVQRALCTAKRGRLLQSGMEVVIVGRPNVGKSSLLNTWSGTDRAIVTEIPGTTRDIVESSVVVGGFPVRLLDTAGIRETQDKVESIGVQRSTSAAVDADVIIMVVSAADGWTDADDTIVERIWGCCTGSHDHATAPSSSPPSSSSPLHGGVWEAGSLSGPMSIAAVPAEVGSQEEAQQVSQFARRRRRPLAPAILAVNKVDRAPFHAVRVPPHAADVFRTMVATSATVGSGIDDLERAILDLVGVGDVASDGLGWTVNQRQAEQLVRAGEALERVKASIEQNLPVDFWTIDLRDAALALGQISGDDVAEEVLSGVFSRFCIGK